MWDDLKDARGSEAAQRKSAQMRLISKGKGSTAAQMKAIEKEVVSRLVSFQRFDRHEFVVVHVNFVRCYF